MAKPKKRQERIDLQATADHYRHETESTRQNKGNKGRDRGQNEDGTPAIHNNTHNDESSEYSESSDAQTDFDPYLTSFKDLKMKLEATLAATDDVITFYTPHQVEFRKVDTTRQQLNEATKKCSDYRDVIATLKNLKGEEEQELTKELASVEKDRKELAVLKAEVAIQKQQLAEEKSKFQDMMKTKEADQLLQLQKEKAKLESHSQKQYAKQVEDLKKATKKSQDDDSKKMLDLQSKNNELVKELEEQRRRLKDTEKKSKDIEKLRSLSETEVEDLSQRLKMAENQFGLCTNSAEYFESEFLKISNDVRAISLRYVEKIEVNELDAAIHDKIEEIDDDFSSVPISNSVVSKELCLAHFQRVISSQLQAILWQPFSSEITVQDPKQNSLLDRIYNGLAESSYEGKISPRAARTYAALAIHGLHSQSTSTKRAEIFTKNVMKVLSLLLNPKIHPALQKDLTCLATSAISLWSIVQTDEREFEVHPSLGPASFEKPDDIDLTDSRVFVLFPCVTARSRLQVVKTRPVGLPGGWVDSKPELPFEEICIHKGVGLPDWEQSVRAGEEEEEDRRRMQVIESNEKKRKELEEEMAKLNKPDIGHRRANSYSRKNSMLGRSNPSSPTSAWLGGNKIPEKE